jgi:SAM-dependent methyltransferase
MKPAPSKEFGELIREWDAIAELRLTQMISGEDISFDYVLKPALHSLLDPGRRYECIVDVGCGTGVLTSSLSQRGAVVVGIDPSAKSIALAREHFGSTGNVTFLESTVESYAADLALPRCDAVVSNMVLMDTLNLDGFLDAIWKLCKPTGEFIFTMTHPAFFPKYRGYEDADWFDYRREIVIEAKFSISKFSTDFTTTHVHRPLERYVTALGARGLVIKEFRELFPDESAHRLYERPWAAPRYIAIKCSKPA